MKHTKLFAVLLALILGLTTLFVACDPGDSGDDETGGGTTTAPGSTAESTEEQTIDIPENVNMNNKTFTVMSASWYGTEGLAVVDIFPETESSDPVLSEAYYRAIKVQEQLKCVIVPFEAPDLDDFVYRLQQDVMAERVNDVVMIRGRHLLSSIMSTYLADLDDMEYTDFTAPWWDNGSSETLRVGGKLFFTLGDFSMNPLRAINMTVYNKDIMKDLKMDNMNEIVTAGEWTVDNMLELAKKAANDVDNSGTLDNGEVVGFSYMADSIKPLVSSAGVRWIEVDEDGEPYMVADETKYIDRLEHLLEVYTDWRYVAETLRYNTDVHGRWRDGETLFYIAPVFQAEDIRDCEFDLGIAPLPKYSEEEDYRGSIAAGYCSYIAVPYTNSDYENTGIFMELMAYEGYKNIRPEFYENMLLRKVARDDESAEMLDFIFTNVVLDLGTIYNFGNIVGGVWNMVAYPDDYPLNIASDLAEKVPTVDAEIEAFMEKVRSYGE